MEFEEQLNTKKKINKATLKRLLPFFSNHKKSLIISLITVVVSAVLASRIPVVFRYLIDNVIPQKSFDLILMVGIGYFFLIIVHISLEYFLNVSVGFMGTEIINEMKLRMFKHVLKLSIRFFDKNATGKLISRIESDCNKLYMLFSSIGVRVLWAFVLVSMSFATMLMESWKLTMIVLPLIPIFGFGTWFIFSKMREKYRIERELYAKLTAFLGEYIKAIPLLQNLRDIDWAKEKLHDLNTRKRTREIKNYMVHESVGFFMFLIPDLIIGFLFYKSVGWISSGTTTIGTVWMFITYIQMSIHPIIMVSEQISELQRAFGAADKIFGILDTEEEVKNAENPTPYKFEKYIKFENLNFHYEEEKPVLKGINLTIEKGSTVAIVGHTGCGKTTTISLLARFYDPISGKITIDDVDIRDIDIFDLRENMSLVLQDIYLFPGNMLDNLRVLRDDIPEEKVISAAKAMGIENHIQKFPDGYQTVLAEDGGNLSYGERQLLSFSRAMTFEPDILIMDEATSSVDPYTEAEIQRSLLKLVENRTSIIIAHRLSTITHADKIVVIDNGSIIEEGPHEKLLEMKGKYHELYTTQMGTNETETDIIGVL